MFPNWSFGIREEEVQKNVDAARAEGAELVVLLSHNGFDVDRKLASRGSRASTSSSPATPMMRCPNRCMVGKTLLIASGSHGKFLSRLDLDVQGGEVKDFRYQLIPVFSDVITPDPEMTALVDKVRAPYEAELERVLGTTDSLLYRRGNFNGTFDDLICDALLAERDAEIALSPGFRWGTTLLPGQDDHRRGRLHNAPRMTYPDAYRSTMTGEQIKDILEDVADNLFNPDPYYQQGGDMVRVGGMGYAIDVRKRDGRRASRDMTLLKTGEPIDAGQGLRRRRLGLGQRRHRRPADLGCRRGPSRKKNPVVPTRREPVGQGRRRSPARYGGDRGGRMTHSTDTNIEWIRQ